MVCNLRKCLSELVHVLSMEEDTLPFLFAGRFVGWDFRDRHIGLTFAVGVSVDVIDASSGADALGDYWLIHFDDVF